MINIISFQCFLASEMLDHLLSIPDQLRQILTNSLAYLCIVCFLVGVVLSTLGAIWWVIGLDGKKGKKTLVKGIIIIGFSLLLGCFGMSIIPSISF